MDVKFLDNFIIQSQTDNLKTKDLFPKSIFDLDMKVSFGMGVPTYVPWISILGPGMTTSNGYYPVYLYYKKENILILAYGISETNPFENPWTLDVVEENQKISEFLTKPFKYKDSYVFKSYTPKILNNVVTYFNNNVQIGKACLITAQVGIAGSTKVGDNSQMGGQAGVVPHVEIGPNSIIAAKSGVTKSLSGDQMYGGYPARPIRDQHKRDAVHREVSLLKKKVQQLIQGSERY